MIKNLLHFITIILYKFLKKIFIFRTFSQEGEDIIINRLYNFKNPRSKIFLDIGAGHPIKYSNTFLLYINGLNGISIDANNKNIFLHKIFRPKDISKKLLISSNTTNKYFYIFEDSELNTSSKKKVNFLKKRKINYKKKILYQTLGVKDFFKKYINKKIKKIIFFNLDVEGLEYEIIKDINWKLFKPKVICIEIFDYDLNKSRRNKIIKLLSKNGYKLKSKLYNSSIFVKK